MSRTSVRWSDYYRDADAARRDILVQVRGRHGGDGPGAGGGRARTDSWRHTVSRRTREIGVRMAVGASPSDVRRMVLRQGLMLTLVGTVAGMAASYGVGGSAPRGAALSRRSQRVDLPTLSDCRAAARRDRRLRGGTCRRCRAVAHRPARRTAAGLSGHQRHAPPRSCGSRVGTCGRPAAAPPPAILTLMLGIAASTAHVRAGGRRAAAAAAGARPGRAADRVAGAACERHRTCRSRRRKWTR